MKTLTLIALAATVAVSQAQGIVIRKEISVVYPKEIGRDGRGSISAIGGLTIGDNSLLQGGLLLSYDVRHYQFGIVGRFVQGRPGDWGLYVGVRF